MFGKNNTLVGQTIIRITRAITANRSGSASIVYSSIGHFNMPQTVNIATPTGGVIPPRVTQVIMTKPK